MKIRRSVSDSSTSQSIFLARNSEVSADATVDFPDAGNPVIQTANPGLSLGITVGARQRRIEFVLCQDGSGEREQLAADIVRQRRIPNRAR